jgi:hypothetical protein
MATSIDQFPTEISQGSQVTRRLRREIQPGLKGIDAQPQFSTSKVRSLENNGQRVDVVATVMGIVDLGTKFDDAANNERLEKMKRWQIERMKLKKGTVVFFRVLGNFHRQRYLRFRKSIICIQSHVRKRRALATFQKILRGVVKIQACVKSRQLRTTVKKWRHLVNLIEVARMRYNRRVELIRREYDAAKVIQCLWRKAIAVRILKHLKIKKLQLIENFKRREACIAIARREQGETAARYIQKSLLRVTLGVAVLISVSTFLVPFFTFADLDKIQHLHEADSRWAQEFVRGGEEITDISNYFSEWPLHALTGVSMNKNAAVMSSAGDAAVKSAKGECRWIVDTAGSLTSFSDPTQCIALDVVSWLPSFQDITINPIARAQNLWCSGGRSVLEPRPPLVEVARAMSFFQVFSLFSLFVAVICSSVVSKYIPSLRYNLIEFKRRLKSLDKAIHFSSLSPNFSEVPMKLMYRGTYIMLISWAFLASSVYFGVVAYKLRYSLLVLPFSGNICRDYKIAANADRALVNLLFGSFSNTIGFISAGTIPKHFVDVIVELSEIVLYTVPIIGAVAIVKNILNSQDRISRIGSAGAKKLAAICAEVEGI